MRYLSALAGLVSVGIAQCTAATTSVLYEFPSDTWIENLAVRPSGELLITLIDKPLLYQVDPSTPGTATLIHDFGGNASLTGISVTTLHDTYAVITGEKDATTGLPMAGTFTLWSLDMRNFSFSSPATVKKLIDIPEAQFLNGMARLYPVADDFTVLIADSVLGVVWLVDTLHPSDYHVVIDDPLFKRTLNFSHPLPSLGINGLHVFEGTTLYFSNTDQAIIGRVPISSDGSATGKAEILAHTLVPDDFALDPKGNVYVAAGANGVIEFVSVDGKKKNVVAGSETETILAGITALKFGVKGTDNHTLYATTSGGEWVPVNGTVVIPGQVVAVDLDK